jgi:hypothetical protein
VSAWLAPSTCAKKRAENPAYRERERQRDRERYYGKQAVGVGAYCDWWEGMDRWWRTADPAVARRGYPVPAPEPKPPAEAIRAELMRRRG